MRPTARRGAPRFGSRGQSMIEYLLVAGIAVALIAIPIEGHTSAVDLMLGSIRTAYAKFLAAMSIPQ